MRAQLSCAVAHALFLFLVSQGTFGTFCAFGSFRRAPGVCELWVEQQFADHQRTWPRQGRHDSRQTACSHCEALLEADVGLLVDLGAVVYDEHAQVIIKLDAAAIKGKGQSRRLDQIACGSMWRWVWGEGVLGMAS